MLEKDIRKKTVLILGALLLIISCDRNVKNNDTKFKETSISTFGEKEYINLLKLASDTIEMRKLSNIIGSADTTYSVTKLDSLICINKNKNRFISCIHNYGSGLNRTATSDGLKIFYGEKINSNWHFFYGASIVIPREMAPNHDKRQPLSYTELHHIALKEVYAPYLTENGEINEDWFISHFEGPGWGFFDQQEKFDWMLKGKRFKTKKEYFEYAHMHQIWEMWANRDTTQPIKLLLKKDTLVP